VCLQSLTSQHLVTPNLAIFSNQHSLQYFIWSILHTLFTYPLNQLFRNRFFTKVTQSLFVVSVELNDIKTNLAHFSLTQKKLIHTKVAQEHVCVSVSTGKKLLISEPAWQQDANLPRMPPVARVCTNNFINCMRQWSSQCKDVSLRLLTRARITNIMPS
jgi:hypothetical protein